MYLVVATAKEPVNVDPPHRHVAYLYLADGRRIPRATAIRRIRQGIEGYYALAHGRDMTIEVASRCERCDAPYLRADLDSPWVDTLLTLPDG